MRIPSTLALALVGTAVAAVAADAAAPGASVYRVTAATGSERLTFSADPDTCAQFRTCGRHGTITYKFGGTPSGSLVVKRDRRGWLKGDAAFRTKAATVANITATSACSETVRRHTDAFTFTSRSRAGRLAFALHGRSNKTDYLKTGCPGPAEAALARSGAMPSGSYSRADFNSPRTSFRLHGSGFFRDRGYRGSTSWKLAFSIVRSSCSPRCAFPARP